MRQIAECISQFANVKNLVSNMETNLINKLFDMKDSNNQLEINLVKKDLDTAQDKEKQAVKEGNNLRQENSRLLKIIEESQKGKQGVLDPKQTKELHQTLSDIRLELETNKSRYTHKINNLEEQCKFNNNMKISLEKEANTLRDRLITRDKEITRLEERNSDQTRKCERLSDEIISLKVHHQKDSTTPPPNIYKLKNYCGR